MANRIKQYLIAIEKLLDNPPPNIDYREEVKKHLIQMGFFMHERLIHLIVTVLFAIAMILVFLYTIQNPAPMLFLLMIALLILLIPYVLHYYLLENSVQKMYKQYDELLRRKKLQEKEENSKNPKEIDEKTILY